MEVDLEAGLPEAIKLKIKGWQHYQQLDYEQLPFKCRHCHEYDHFQRNCPKIQEIAKERGKKADEGWHQTKRQRAPRKRDPKNPNPTSSVPKVPDPPTSGNRFAALEVPEEEPTVEPDPGKEGTREQPEEATSTRNQGDSTKSQPQEVPEDESEADSSEGENPDPKTKGKQGRKSSKEKRDAETYAEKLAGNQPTLHKLLGQATPRNTRNQANASKGASSNPKGK